MTSFLVTVTVGMVLIGAISGQTAKQEWTASELGDPQTNAMKCGFPNNYPAFICDPNGILGSDLRAVNWILSDAAHNSTKCPCSTYFCENGNDERTIGKGYKIGVALVKRMKKQRSSDGKLLTPEDMAQKFAYELKNYEWKMGYCEEDIIVFYSVDDKMLAIYTGSTAAMKLTPYYRDLLAFKVGGRLSDGRIVEALNVLLYDMKTILNCDAKSTSDCSLYERRGSGGVINMPSLSMTSLIALSWLFLLSR